MRIVIICCACIALFSCEKPVVEVILPPPILPPVDTPVNDSVNNAVWLDYDGWQSSSGSYYQASGLDSIDMVEIIDSLSIYFDSLDIVFTLDSAIRARRLQHTVLILRQVSGEQGSSPGPFAGDYVNWSYLFPNQKNNGTANNIAHETGHALTLQHNINPNDLMNGKTVFRYARFNKGDKEIMKVALVL